MLKRCDFKFVIFDEICLVMNCNKVILLYFLVLALKLIQKIFYINFACSLLAAITFNRFAAIMYVIRKVNRSSALITHPTYSELIAASQTFDFNLAINMSFRMF